jgi:hypothetical protein
MGYKVILILLAVLAWALVGARLAGLGQGVATVNRPALPTLNFFVAREDLLVLYGNLDCRGLGSDSVASVANQDLTPSSLRGSVSSVLVSLKRRGHRELHLDCGASRPVIGRGYGKQQEPTAQKTCRDYPRHPLASEGKAKRGREQGD